MNNEYTLAFTGEQIDSTLNKMYEILGDDRNLNINLINFEDLQPGNRFSPGGENIVTSNGTVYSLLVLKLVPNSTYIVSTNIGGAGLFYNLPERGSIASETLAPNNAGVSFNSKEF